MKDYPRLPESELDIMLVVWELKEATAPAILERLERPLTASALHSYLKRLEEKGYLACRKEGKTNRYTPLVEREAYRRQEGRAILGKLYEGSLKRFAAALHDGGALDQSEVEELRAYLDELEEKGACKWRPCFCAWSGCRPPCRRCCCLCCWPPGGCKAG